MSHTYRFFEPTKGMDSCSASDYKNVKQYRDCLAFMSSFNNQSLYVIDYYKQTFYYVSEHPLFLCGYKPNQVKKWGFHYFEMVIPPDDLKMILEISDQAFRFFYRLPVESRTDCYISYDFRMKQPNGTYLLINHKLKPMILTPQGFIWLALCEVKQSTGTQPGNVIITTTNEQLKYKYSFDCRKFKPYCTIPLTKREKEVLQLVMSGITTSEIASALFVNPDTIKYHKKNIYKKLGVKNSIQIIHNAMAPSLV